MLTIIMGLTTGTAALVVGILGIYNKWEMPSMYFILIGLGSINLLLASLLIMKLEGF